MRTVVDVIFGLIVGAVIAVAGFVLVLRFTDFGYHRITVTNDTDAAIFVNIGDAPTGRSRGTVAAHSTRVVKGSRFEAPTQVLVIGTGTSSDRICYVPWAEATKEPSFVVRSLDDVCCPANGRVFVVNCDGSPENPSMIPSPTLP